MRWTHLMLVAAGMTLGWVLSHLPLTDAARAADAASAAVNPPGRYQLSAFASGTDLTNEHGCYVLDTSTGRVWRLQGRGMDELQSVGK